jgi:precorrin-2 dehydrogenase / sirohydrochlorin ferrochelatase
LGFYPVFLQLEGKGVLVVGGGQVAERKVLGLLECGAQVLLVSETLTDRLIQLAEQGRIRCLGSSFSETLLEGVFLVIAATDDPQVNRRGSLAAQRRHLLVNAVDQPAECNFIVPSLVRRGALLVAISTSGKSPALARRIRRDLEGLLGPGYSRAVELMGRIRTDLLPLGLSPQRNRRILSGVVDSGLVELLERGDEAALRRVLKRELPAGLDAGRLLAGLCAETGESS